jgi:rSAM/selenodomain-associated transferase 1
MSAQILLDPAAPPVLPPHLCALGIMTKAPVPGRVKTRLSPPLTPDEAAQLNICFLRDLGRSITQAAAMSPGRGVGVYTPVGAEAAYKNILPSNFFLIVQRGESFEERLVAASDDLFRAGFHSVCLINSDSPTVSAGSFAEAAIELANPRDRVVLGPSHDGGYYLIGMKKTHRRLFQQIDWSTERVADQTRARAAEIGLPVHELSPGLDVDDGKSLARLCEELFRHKDAGDGQFAPATRDFLKTLRESGRLT